MRTGHVFRIVETKNKKIAFEIISPLIVNMKQTNWTQMFNKKYKYAIWVQFVCFMMQKYTVIKAYLC